MFHFLKNVIMFFWAENGYRVGKAIRTAVGIATVAGCIFILLYARFVGLF